MVQTPEETPETEIPVEKLVFDNVNECTLYGGKQGCSNGMCVAHLNETSSNVIQGNFIPIMREKKFLVLNKKFDYTDPYTPNRNMVGKCLEYRGNASGSFKKVYLNMEDKTGNKFITTDEVVSGTISSHKAVTKEINGETSVSKTSTNLSGHLSLINKQINEKLKNIYNEITIHQRVYETYQELVPRIYAANIYVAKIDTNKDCDLLFEYRVQTLMDDVTDNGFEFVDLLKIKYEDFLKSFHISGNDTDGLKGDWLEYLKIILSANNEVTSNSFNNDISSLSPPSIKNWLNVNKAVLTALFTSMKKIHSLNIVHHDIKDGNMAYNSNSKTMKLIDFGLATTFKQSKQNVNKIKVIYRKLFPNLHAANKDIIDIVLSAHTYRTDEHIFFHEMFVTRKEENLIRSIFLGNCFNNNNIDMVYLSNYKILIFFENQINDTWTLSGVKKEELEYLETKVIPKFNESYNLFLETCIFPMKDLLYEMYINA